jgi:hypothetical protein
MTRCIDALHFLFITEWVARTYILLWSLIKTSNKIMLHYETMFVPYNSLSKAGSGMRFGREMPMLYGVNK